MSVRCMVLASIHCPRCAASSDSLRAWRTSTQIIYVCGECDHTWAIDVPIVPPAKSTNLIAHLRFFNY
jgi:Zn ribbon nucleic-acid-binding protein